MAPTQKQVTSTVVKLGVALLGGFVVFVLLVPTSGAEPPLCYSLLAYRVPCEGGTAIAGGAATAVLGGLALLLINIRRNV
jgi:hypothetical protein